MMESGIRSNLPPLIPINFGVVIIVISLKSPLTTES